MGHPLDISRKVNHRDIERRVTQQDRPNTKRTAGTDPNAESCCCPKCNTDLPVTASCECLPDICVTVYDADGVILDELLGTWGTERFFTGTITIGDCEIPIKVTNGWGGSDPPVPGFRLTSTSWECLGIPECGLFQAITCSEWKSGEEVEVSFELDTTECPNCDDVGIITVKLRPKATYRPKCDGCGCVDEYMCISIPTGDSKRARQVDGVWAFPPITVVCAGEPYVIAVKLEGRSAECSDCVWKLSFAQAGISYSDEEYWIEAGCDGAEWENIVVNEGTEDETTLSYIQLTKSSCTDCVPMKCCDRDDLPETLTATITSLTNCTCNDWVGETITLTRVPCPADIPGFLLWFGCTEGPCDIIGGVPTDQGLSMFLTCALGEVGQVGTPSDFELYVGNHGDSTPCPTYPFSPSPINPANNADQDLEASACDPLSLVFDIGPIAAAICQDPMAPPGPAAIIVTVTE